VPMPSGPGPAGPGSFKDLPIVPLLPAQQNATHIIEVITDCDVKFNLDSVKKLMANSQYDELPSPLFNGNSGEELWSVGLPKP
jgi:hypothetical protein